MEHFDQNLMDEGHRDGRTELRLRVDEDRRRLEAALWAEVRTCIRRIEWVITTRGKELQASRAFNGESMRAAQRLVVRVNGGLAIHRRVARDGVRENEEVVMLRRRSGAATLPLAASLAAGRPFLSKSGYASEEPKAGI